MAKTRQQKNNLSKKENSRHGYRKSDNYNRWEWARRLIDLADALIQRDEPGDQELARQHLQQSLDMFTEMGAPGYIKVLEERMENL